MTKTILQIDGMSCGMCEAHINDVIRRTFNVKSVKSSAKKHQTEIISKEPLDDVAITKAIADTGYELKGITSEEYVKKGLFSK